MGRFYRIIFFIGILTPACSTAQTMDCEQTIAYATDEFNAGHFYAVPSILSNCLTSFNRDQRQRAHLLLTQTYLLLDDPIGAQRSYLEVLAANPEFVPDEQLHSIDVVYLSKRFTATPKFSWFVHAGSNVSPVRVILTREPAQSYDSGKPKKSYSLRPGYNFGVGGEYSYNDNLRLRMETNFFQTAYKLEATRLFQNDDRTVIDRQIWLNVPIYLCYSDNVGPYRPYGYAGFAISRLFVDRASIDWRGTRAASATDAIEEGPAQSISVASPDYDFLHRRNKMNQSVIFGGGVRYKVGLDFVFAEVRYSAGLKNIVNPSAQIVDQRYAPDSPKAVGSQEPGTAYAHQDDYLRLDNLAITFGFVRPLYKPRELKRARTNSVLRKMKRAQ